MPLRKDSSLRVLVHWDEQLLYKLFMHTDWKMQQLILTHFSVCKTAFKMLFTLRNIFNVRMYVYVVGLR